MNKKILNKYTLQLILGFILAIFGIALVTAGFICPPLAYIEPSVLTALGEIFTFSAACLGIDANYKFKIAKYSKTTDGEQIETE